MNNKSESESESYIKFPNPFDLFKPQVREGATDETTSSSTEKKSDTKSTISGAVNPKISFSGFMIGIFFFLAFLLGLVYYFNSSIFLIDDLMKTPYYTVNNFWNIFKGRLVSGKIAIYLITWMFIFALNILIFDIMFNNHDTLNIFYITSMFYWTIVGSTFLIIGNIPSLVEVFENTIGYGIMTLPIPGLFDLKDTMRCIKNKQYRRSNKNYDISNEFLLTTFDIPSFHEHFNSLNGYTVNTNNTNSNNFECDFYIDLLEKRDDENCEANDIESKEDLKLDIKNEFSIKKRKELLKLVLSKNTIGHYSWTLLASFVSIMLTINSIITT
jgi:hypothetical protein